jgi:two-component system phosphate regulon sensor histidine kinase PhoR
MKIWTRYATIALIVVIGLLLPVLAFLQYRWLGELSRLEQRHRADNLRVAARRFSGDFDSELANLYQTFHVREAKVAEAETELSNAYEAWSGSIAYPQLVKAVFWVEVFEEGPPRIRQLDAVNARLDDIEWPPELDQLREDFASRGNVDPLQAAAPALVVEQHGSVSEPWVVILLDLDVIAGEFLSERVALFSPGAPIDFDAIIVENDERERVVYATNSQLSPTELFEYGDAGRAWFFGLHSRDFSFDWIEALPTAATEHRWILYVRHQPGALEAAVGAIRTRNLLSSFGILVLLTGSIALLLLFTRRAQRWARLQLEYVARIAHELRTPLAVIGFASENLADDVVDDLDRARTYGKVINKESRRLTKLVESALLHSKLESGAAAEMERQPIRIDEIIEAALNDSDVAHANIHKDLAAGLPSVMGDVEALKSALQNLFANAVKYSDEPCSLSVSAKSKANGHAAAVEIEIEDRGRGISAADLPHIFEPFYRGKDARDEQIEGSGIGLSLVKHVVDAHGGTIRVTCPAGGGSRFTVVLPASL